MPQPICKIASNLQFFYSIIIRALLLAVIVYLYYQYAENPAVVIVLIALVLLLFLLYGNDEIAVYADYVEIQSTSLWSVFTGPKRYDITDIEKASLLNGPEPGKEEPGLVVFAFLIKIIYFFGRRRFYSQREFFLHLRNGRRVTIATGLPETKIKEAVLLINNLTGKQAEG